ncbi:unnamed protein product [Moneuplotes crassus]|uniref:Uncharacterized protein n=1 Tax=Euplotes crassus TaxID=5936 RepID=A0AAD1Y3L2_EUPCR|nr:unnamed protein product [Moneuplotes crassus]
MGGSFKKIVYGMFKSVREIDSYGTPIPLHYRGDDKFKTYVGGSVTILVHLVLLSYASYLLAVMFRREDVTYNTSRVIRDLNQDLSDHKPAQHGFAIGIGFRWNNISFLDEEFLKMYRIRAYQFSAILQPSGWKETEEELELVKCKDHFPYYNQTQLKRFRINNFVCIKTKDYSLVGNLITDVSKTLKIKIGKCSTSERTDCDTSSYPDNYIFSQYLEVAMINSYFDVKSFNDPIKTYLTQEYYYTYQANSMLETNFYLKENNVKALDDYTLIDGTKKEKFYTVSREKTDRYTYTSDNYAEIEFHLDPETEVYTRNVFTFMDMLANIGGIFSLLNSFAMLIVGLYGEKMLKNSIIAKCYTLDKSEISQEDFCQDGLDNFKSENDHIPEENNNVENQNSPQDNFIDEEKENKKEESEDFEGGSREGSKEEEKEYQTSRNFNTNYDDELLRKLNNKRRYNYSHLDMIYNSFCLFKRRKWCRKKYINSQIYNKGFEKYSLDTDICNIISVCHQSKLLIEWLLDEKQIFLSKFGNKSSLSCIDEDIRNPLKDIIKYKCKNFYEREEQFIHKNEEFVKKISIEGVRDFDQFLINQIEPSPSPKHHHHSPPKDAMPTAIPATSKGGKRSTTPFQTTHSNEKQEKMNGIKIKRTLPKANYRTGEKLKREHLKREEDIDSCDLNDIGIEFNNQNSMIEKYKREISGTAMHQLNKNSNPYKAKIGNEKPI